MGDFQANFHRPTDTGIHTVEGNVAGASAASLEKKRQREQEEFEERKRKITFDAAQQKVSIHSKFAGGTGSVIERSSQDCWTRIVLTLKRQLLKPKHGSRTSTTRNK
jgi:ribosomal protein L21E